MQRRYLSVNLPFRCSYLLYDVDRSDGAYAASEAGLPVPTWITVNPANGHAHLAYGLRWPVYLSGAARPAPIAFVQDVDRAIRHTLGADLAYSGFLTRNPFSGHWPTYGNGHLFTLEELRAEVEVERLPAVEHVAGIGRNVETFEASRKQAYKAIRQYWTDRADRAGLDYWQRYLTGWATDYTTERHVAPLCAVEVAGIARSVAGWVWNTFSRETFSAIQSARGRKGGRPRKPEPWKLYGISKATYYRNRQYIEAE